MNVFLRNVSKLFSGKLVSMLVAVAATPIISRLFSPEDYGIAAFFVAAAMILSTIYTLAYSRAIVFPKDQEIAGNLLVVALTASVTVCVSLYLIMATCEFLWPQSLSGAGLGELVWLLPLAALLLAIREILRNLSLRRDYYTTLALADFSESTIMSTTRIFWGLFLTASVTGLIIGHFVGLMLAIVICLSVNAGWCNNALRTTNRLSLRKTACAFKDYPLYRMPARFAFISSSRLPILAIAAIFPAEVAGYYAMASRAANVPLQMAGQSVADVLLRSMLDLNHVGEKLASGVIKVALLLFATGLPLFMMIYLVGEDLLTLFLGDRWVIAGQFLQILSPYLFLLWVGSFAATVFETLRLNKLRLQLNLTNLGIRLVTFGLCGYLDIGSFQTLRAYTYVSCVYIIVTIWVAIIMVLRHDQGKRKREGLDL